jgi:hypothetical protein
MRNPESSRANRGPGTSQLDSGGGFNEKSLGKEGGLLRMYNNGGTDIHRTNKGTASDLIRQHFAPRCIFSILLLHLITAALRSF